MAKSLPVVAPESIATFRCRKVACGASQATSTASAASGYKEDASLAAGRQHTACQVRARHTVHLISRHEAALGSEYPLRRGGKYIIRATEIISPDEQHRLHRAAVIDFAVEAFGHDIQSDAVQRDRR